MDERQKLKFIAQIRKNVAAKQWTCIEPGCNRTAINSHLLQRNGILSNIADNGHLYEIKGSDIHRWNSKSQRFEFRKVGISKALALPLFCDTCDSSIFKFIEKDQMNLYSYPGFVLLNYRVTCAEQRKKQIEAEVFQRTLNAKTLKGNVDAFTIEKFLYGYQLGIRDLDNLKDIIKKEIESPEEIFRFEAFRYPLTKVYGAALFGTTDENTKDDPERFEFDDIFIHVIPFQDSMGVLCGYIKKFETDWTVNYVHSWREINESDLKVRLTDLFAARIENWGIAPSLFESIPKKTIGKMIDFWDTNAMSLHKSLKTDFNFFE